MAYPTLISHQQDLLTINVASRFLLDDTVFAHGTFFRSTSGGAHYNQPDYTVADSPGNIAAFPGAGAVSVAPTSRTGLPPSGGSYFSQATIDDQTIAFFGASSSFPTLSAWFSTAPNAGGIEALWHPSTAGSSTHAIGFNPVSVCLDNAGDKRLLFGIDSTISVAPAGTGFGFNPNTHAIELINLFAGLDTTTAGSGIMAWRPKSDGSGNHGLWSGVYIGSANTRMIFIETDLSGAEIARSFVQLNNPTFDNLFNQPPGGQGVKQILPTEYGWAGALSAALVNPPSFIVFSEDMTKYWIVTIICDDAQSLNAVYQSFWGQTFFETFYMAAPPSISAPANAIQILGAVGDPTLIIGQNPRTVARPTIIPPYPPVIQAACVPCAPMLIQPPAAGPTPQGSPFANAEWHGRVGGNS